MTLLVAPLITETVFEPLLVTYTYPLDESKATPCGEFDLTVILAMTLLVAPLITETLPELGLATYTYPLDESKATPIGNTPLKVVFTEFPLIRVLFKRARVYFTNPAELFWLLS